MLDQKDGYCEGVIVVMLSILIDFEIPTPGLKREIQRVDIYENVRIEHKALWAIAMIS